MRYSLIVLSRPLHDASQQKLSLLQDFGGFPKFRVPFWGSGIKDHSILESTLGYPFPGKLPLQTLQRPETFTKVLRRLSTTCESKLVRAHFTSFRRVTRILRSYSFGRSIAVPTFSYVVSSWIVFWIPLPKTQQTQEGPTAEPKGTNRPEPKLKILNPKFKS